MKLTSVARASLEELRLDYENYLRHRNFELWKKNDPRRQEIINERCSSADDVARWVKKCHKHYGQNRQTGSSNESTKSTMDGTAANAVLVLIAVACSLLDCQMAVQAKSFLEEGGFTERLYNQRKNYRKNKSF
jgi:four helix bundle suffix protein